MLLIQDFRDSQDVQVFASLEYFAAGKILFRDYYKRISDGKMLGKSKMPRALPYMVIN